jgi:hypothetical protein
MRFFTREKGPPLGAILAGAGVLGGLAIRLLRLDHLPIPLCAFRAVTGVPCAGCGSTRALGRLARLDLPGAFAFHPLTTVLALAVLAWGLADLVLLTRRRALRVETTPREDMYLLWTFLVLVLVNWAYLVRFLR